MKACQSWWSEASPRHTITSQSEGFVLESESGSLIHQEGWHPQVDPPWRMSWGYSPPGEMQSSCATLGDNNATDTHALTWSPLLRFLLDKPLGKSPWVLLWRSLLTQCLPWLAFLHGSPAAAKARASGRLLGCVRSLGGHWSMRVGMDRKELRQCFGGTSKVTSFTWYCRLREATQFDRFGAVKQVKLSGVFWEGSGYQELPWARTVPQWRRVCPEEQWVLWVRAWGQSWNPRARKVHWRRCLSSCLLLTRSSRCVGQVYDFPWEGHFSEALENIAREKE